MCNEKTQGDGGGMQLRENDEIMCKKNVESVKRGICVEKKLFVGVSTHERVPNCSGSYNRLTREENA